MSVLEVGTFEKTADLGFYLHRNACFHLGKASKFGCQGFICFLVLDMFNLTCRLPTAISVGNWKCIQLKSLRSVRIRGQTLRQLKDTHTRTNG